MTLKTDRPVCFRCKRAITARMVPDRDWPDKKFSIAEWTHCYGCRKNFCERCTKDFWMHSIRWVHRPADHGPQVRY